MTLISTITLSHGGPGSNGNKEVTPHSPELQNWNLVTRYSLVSYPGHSFLVESRLSGGYCQYILSSDQQGGSMLNISRIASTERQRKLMTKTIIQKPLNLTKHLESKSSVFSKYKRNQLCK